MSIITISSIFETLDDYMQFCDEWCVSMLIDTSNYQDTLATYVYLPVWLRYVETPIKFTNDEKGIEAFKRNFCNQLNEVVLDFYTYCKENIDYFLYQTDALNEGKPMSKNITTGINPINQTLDQEVDSTNLASGTGSQFISETVYNGVAWHKLVDAYFTPNRKTALLKAFAWLFVTTYSPETKYDDKIEERREVDLSFVDEDENIIDVQEVYPSKTYYTMSEVDINRPVELVPENIKKDVDIAGIVGTLETPLLDYLDYPLDLTGDMDIEASDYNVDGIKEVFIGIPVTAKAENIKYGVDIGGIVGTYQVTDALSHRINYTTDLYDYEIPEGITRLRGYAFYNDANLKSLKLPSTLTTINNNCFNSNTNLTDKISVDDISTLCNLSLSGSIAQSPFGWGAKLYVNGTLTNIINIPSDITTIKEGFAKCSNITELNVLHSNCSLSTSGWNFSYCTGLTNITVNFTTFQSDCFNGCTSLETVDCLSNLSTITQRTFYGCTSLKDIYLRNNARVWLNSTNAIPSGQNITIHVPSALISTYQTLTNWSTLYNNGDVTFVAI